MADPTDTPQTPPPPDEAWVAPPASEALPNDDANATQAPPATSASAPAPAAATGDDELSARELEAVTGGGFFKRLFSGGANKDPGSIPRMDSRKYIRIPSVIPVDIQLVSKTSGPMENVIRTGLTQDLSAEGLCVQVRTLPEPLAKHARENSSDLVLYLDLALPGQRVRVQANVVWCRPASKGLLFGLQFEDLVDTQRKALIKYARRASMRPKLIRSGVALLLLGAVGMTVVYSYSLDEERTALAETQTELGETSQKYDELSAQLDQQTQKLLTLSNEIDETLKLAEGDETKKGAEEPEADNPDAALTSLSTNITQLRTLTALLSQQVQAASQMVKRSKKGRKLPRLKKKSKKRRRKKR